MAGHGLHAAATMGRLRAAVHTLASLDLEPDEVLARLDDLVELLAAEQEAGSRPPTDEQMVGATCLYAVYDPVSRHCTMARAGHPLARKAKLQPRDLARFPWVLRDPSAPSRKLLDQVFRRLGLESAHVAVQAGDLGLLRGLLMQSDMLTAVSPQHLLHELQAGTLAALRIALPGSMREVGFVLRKDAQPSAPCVLLMDEIRLAAAQRVSAGD